MNIRTYHACIIREATEIIKHPHNFNHEDGYRLSQAGFTCFPQATHPTTLLTKQPLNLLPEQVTDPNHVVAKNFFLSPLLLTT
jgi:hypothetical protein